MADVSVTVMVDGKTVFVAAGAGAVDVNMAAARGLQHGLTHFQEIMRGQIPQTSTGPLTGPLAGAQAAKDTSL